MLQRAWRAQTTLAGTADDSGGDLADGGDGGRRDGGRPGSGGGRWRGPGLADDSGGDLVDDSAGGLGGRLWQRRLAGTAGDPALMVGTPKTAWQTTLATRADSKNPGADGDGRRLVDDVCGHSD